MTIMYAARQKTLSLSECEGLCVRHSRDVELLVSRSGHRAMPGQALRVPVQNALNMLILSISEQFGVESGVMSPHLPGLRNEALLHLGENISNWTWSGPSANEQQFWDQLYGQASEVRPRIASLLRCCENTTTRKLRFHSPSDVERISPAQIWQASDGRTPHFVIDAHELASRVCAACSGPLFVANEREAVH